MKNKLKIVNENGMYVGYALKSNEVVYKTVPYKDSISCSRDLAKNADKQGPVTQTTRSVRPPTVTTSTTTQHLPSNPTPRFKPKRGCCGRG
jgi:hypothetical protein